MKLSAAILALYACGTGARAISRFLEGIYGAFSSPQSVSRLTQVVEEEVQSRRERPLDEECSAVFLDGTFLAIRWRKTVKEPVYLALGVRPDGRREVLRFWLFGAEGESAQKGRRSSKSSGAGGKERGRIFVADDLPDLEEAIRKIFLEVDRQLCVL